MGRLECQRRGDIGVVWYSVYTWANVQMHNKIYSPCWSNHCNSFTKVNIRTHQPSYMLMMCSLGGCRSKNTQRMTFEYFVHEHYFRTVSHDGHKPGFQMLIPTSRRNTPSTVPIFIRTFSKIYVPTPIYTSIVIYTHKSRNPLSFT